MATTSSSSSSSSSTTPPTHPTLPHLQELERLLANKPHITHRFKVSEVAAALDERRDLVIQERRTLSHPPIQTSSSSSSTTTHSSNLSNNHPIELDVLRVYVDGDRDREENPLKSDDEIADACLTQLEQAFSARGAALRGLQIYLSFRKLRVEASTHLASNIALCPRLQVLELSCNIHTLDFSVLLPTLSKLPHLASLKIWCVGIPTSMHDFATYLRVTSSLATSLSRLTSLTRLHLHGAFYFEKPQFASLASTLSKLSKLESFELTCERQKWTHFAALAPSVGALSTRPCYSQIFLESVDESELPALEPAVRQLSKLEVHFGVDIDSSERKTQFEAFKKLLKAATSARELCVWGVVDSQEALFRCIIECGMAHRLTTLDFGCLRAAYAYDKASAAALSELVAACPQLEVLNLDDQRLGTRNLAVVVARSLVSCRQHLRILSLNRNRLDDAFVGVLAPILKECVHLTELNLQNQSALSQKEKSITDGGARALAAALQGCSGLARLCLKGNSLTEVGCSALARALVHSRAPLVELNMSENPLGDSGAAALEPLLRAVSESLEVLMVRECQVGNAGVAGVSHALGLCGRLRYLDVSGNWFGDVGVVALVDQALPRLRRLNYLDFSCEISSSASAFHVGGVIARLPVGCTFKLPRLAASVEWVLGVWEKCAKQAPDRRSFFGFLSGVEATQAREEGRLPSSAARFGAKDGDFAVRKRVFGMLVS